MEREVLTFTMLDELKKELDVYSNSLDEKTHSNTKRVAIVLYDAIRKNTINTEEKLHAIKKVLDLLYGSEVHKENDFITAHRILQNSGIDWIMGDE